MSDRFLQCAVITPERQVLAVKAESVTLPAHDGQIGVLNMRAPLLCEVGIGPMRLTGGEAGEQTLFVDGGFAQVLDNQVTVLTVRAIMAADIDRAAASAALDAANKMPITDDASFEARQKAIARAQEQLKLAR